MNAGPFRRAEGTLKILRHFPGQRRAQFRSRPELEAARDAQEAAAELREILHSAYVEVHPHDELPAEQGGKFRHLVPLHGD